MQRIGDTREWQRNASTFAELAREQFLGGWRVGIDHENPNPISHDRSHRVEDNIEGQTGPLIGRKNRCFGLQLSNVRADNRPRSLQPDFGLCFFSSSEVVHDTPEKRFHAH